MAAPQVIVYTDGGADPNPGPGGWGVVLEHRDSGRKRELSGSHPETTNNRMELTAAIEALKTLKERCEVQIFTDSTYLKNGITRWLPGWVAFPLAFSGAFNCIVHSMTSVTKKKSWEKGSSMGSPPIPLEWLVPVAGPVAIRA